MRDWLKRWRWFCLVVVFLFAMASPAGTLALKAYGWLGRSNVGLILLALVLAVVAVLLFAPILRDQKRRTPGFLAGTISLGLAYLFCLTRMAPHPVGKIHFATFGLLAYLSYSAMEKKGGGNPFLKTFFLVSLIGFLDEVYQGLLPNRQYDEQDIIINMTAVFLGLLLTLFVKRARPGSVFSGILHKGNIPYVLLWLPAGALYLYIHAVPLPTETVLGTWHRVGDCHVEEWLRLERDRTFSWWDEEGNWARGTYRITGNRLEGVFFRNRGLEAENRSHCGWGPGPVMHIKVQVDAERLLYVIVPDRPWTRAAPTHTNTRSMKMERPRPIDS